MDDPQKDYAKKNKSDRRHHVLHDSTDRKCPEKTHLQLQKVGSWSPGCGDGGVTVNELKGSYLGDKNDCFNTYGDGISIKSLKSLHSTVR